MEKPECHLLYNVTTMASIWHTAATKDVSLLRHQLEQVFRLPGGYTFLNYLRCHDDIGWGLDYDYLENFSQKQIPHKRYLNDYLTGKWPGSPARGELYNDDPTLGDARLCGTTASLCGVETARRKNDGEMLAWALRFDEMLHALILTLSGIPVLYSGDEILQENDYAYHDDPLKADDSRYLHRGDMDWDKAEKRKDPASPEGDFFRRLKKLEEIRRTHRVFDGQADVWLIETDDPGILGIGRYEDGEKLAALFNFSDEEKCITLREDGAFSDAASGETADKSAVRIPAGGFCWLLCEF